MPHPSQNPITFETIWGSIPWPFELLFEIEDRFKIQIPDQDLVGLSTVGSVAAYVQERLAAPTAAPKAQQAKTSTKTTAKSPAKPAAAKPKTKAKAAVPSAKKPAAKPKTGKAAKGKKR